MAAVALAAALGGAVTASAAAGSVTGVVFRDYNSDGTMNPTATAALPAVDTGVGGVTVRAFDSTGAQVGSATTAADGSYTLSYSAAGSTVRVEFTTPAGFTSGPHGTGPGIVSGTSVQFVGAGGRADYGIVAPGDFAQPNPDVAIAVQRFYEPGASGTDSAAGYSITTSPYLTPSNPAATINGTPQANYAQTGTLYGVTAYRSDYIFSAAYFRRSAPLGPLGGSLTPDQRLGEIYLTTAGGALDATPFVTIPNAGSNPRSAGADSRTDTSYDWGHDGMTDAAAQASFAAPGTIGLGDLDISGDKSSLFVVNLGDRHLYRVPLAPAATGLAPTAAGAPVAIAMPLTLPGAATSCPGVVRPFGIDVQGSTVYATLTCTGPAASDLRVYLYAYDTTAGTWGSSPAFELPLQYPRGGIILPNLPDASWHPWNDVFDSITPQSPSPAAFQYADPQPMASDVQFAPNGDLTISIRDRGVEQAGTMITTVADPRPVLSYAAGDILRACGPVGGPWVLESNGTCGGVTATIGRAAFGETNGPGNGEGPGGGEFYLDSYRGHEQTSLGGTEQIPGFTDFLSVQFDTDALGVSGWRRLSHATGAGVGPMWRISPGDFAKAGNLGDLDSLLDQAPIEIGNRVWRDRDRDGVQGATELEPPIAGVTVHLYDGAGTLVATTVTDADGEYYFSSANVPDGLQPGTAYRIALDQASDYAVGGPLDGYLATPPNRGADDARDSDGIPDAAGIRPSVTLTTGSPGDNDHTFDFGFFRPSVSVGDVVWIDSDADGVLDPGEPGIPGVTLDVLGPDGRPVTDVYGTPVPPSVTDSDGRYSFDELPVLPAGQHYTVSIDRVASATALARFTPTTTGRGTRATDSSTWTAESSDLTTDGLRDPTLDFGFVLPTEAVASAPGLAFTGGTVPWLLVAGGGALAVVGIALVVARRRTRS